MSYTIKALFMQFNLKWKRAIKWISISIGILLILILFITIYINTFSQPLLKEKLTASVNKGSSGLYKLSLKTVKINFFSGGLSLDSLKIVPNKRVFDSLKKVNKAPRFLFEVNAKQFKLDGLGYLKVLFKRELNINDLLLSKASIIVRHNEEGINLETTRLKKSLYQVISNEIKLLHIKRITLEEADFKYFDEKLRSETIHEVKKIKLSLTDFLVDSLAENNISTVFYSKNINYEFSQISTITKDGMYNLEIDSFNGDMDNKRTKVIGLKLKPRYNEMQFSRKYSVQKDRYDLKFDTIEVKQLDYVSLFRYKKILINSLKLSDAKVNVFLNRSLPPPMMDKGKNFPHLILRRLKYNTTIDTVLIKNIDVAYTEYNGETNRRGTFYLSNLNGRILNVTNDAKRITINNKASANLNAKIMGSGNLNVKIGFQLDDDLGRFDFSGSIGKFDLKELNELSSNLGMVKVKSGLVNSLQFNATANWTKGVGTLTFLYNDLKIELLKNEDRRLKRKGFLTFLANQILIKSDNPTLKNNEIRKGKIDFNRPPTASFFNLLWKSVFTGIRETVGVGNIPMKSPPQPKGK